MAPFVFVRGAVVAVAAVSLFVCCTLPVVAGSPATPWTAREDLRRVADDRKAVPLPRVTLDLDLAPADRWTHIANQSRFRDQVPAVMAYLESEIPKWAMPLLETVAKSISPYFHDYGAEIEGLATSLGMNKGALVAVNLIMQLEHIGINCSNWNVTGPTVKDDPGCKAVDPSQSWCYCKDAVEAWDEKREGRALPADMMLTGRNTNKGVAIDGPGLCTSVIAEDRAGKIHHGRNLDWNIPAAIRHLMVDVDFMRGGKLLYTGTTAVGFVGLFNAMRPGAPHGFSASIDARKKGGKLLTNLLEALFHKAMTPAQHLRKVFEDAAVTDFSTAHQALAAGDLIDDIYYIVGGSAHNEGIVIARDRNGVADAWPLATPGNNSSSSSKAASIAVGAGDDPDAEDGWFRLQTNYDRKDPVPAADDRRTPGIANMKKLGRDHVPDPIPGGMYSIITTWPTFNHHTDYSAVICAADGLYKSFTWI